MFLFCFRVGTSVVAQMATAATPSMTSVWMMMNVLREPSVAQLNAKILLAPLNVAVPVATLLTLPF